ncbi:MAG: ATP-binding protein [Myxococcales bacterium]|nr:ATP-binding protein [Myxococcales bacterium]
MSSQRQQESRAYFELSFEPNVQLINVVRRFVSDFYDEILGDPDVVSRVALATHEMLENAVRYSTDGATRVRLDVAPDEGRSVLTITMQNQAAPQNREALARLFDEMRNASDPMDHYCAVMRRNAKRTDGSGLGLARIRAEAEMSLDYELSGDLVTLIARTPIEPIVHGPAAAATGSDP